MSRQNGFAWSAGAWLSRIAPASSRMSARGDRNTRSASRILHRWRTSCRRSSTDACPITDNRVRPRCALRGEESATSCQRCSRHTTASSDKPSQRASPYLQTERQLAGCWACSAGYDLRIVFQFVQQDGQEAILLSIGLLTRPQPGALCFASVFLANHHYSTSASKAPRSVIRRSWGRPCWLAMKSSIRARTGSTAMRRVTSAAKA